LIFVIQKHIFFHNFVIRCICNLGSVYCRIGKTLWIQDQPIPWFVPSQDHMNVSKNSNCKIYVWDIRIGYGTQWNVIIFKKSLRSKSQFLGRVSVTYVGPKMILVCTTCFTRTIFLIHYSYRTFIAFFNHLS
jgi:hypothetical protein